jgi:hypothetical protein
MYMHSTVLIKKLLCTIYKRYINSGAKLEKKYREDKMWLKFIWACSCKKHRWKGPLAPQDMWHLFHPKFSEEPRTCSPVACRELQEGQP